jgi:hypothetical protein
MTSRADGLTASPNGYSSQTNRGMLMNRRWIIRLHHHQLITAISPEKDNGIGSISVD